MKKNKKTIVCVFAHPDDEAFGPSGMIAKLAKTCDVYILCATKGEAGQNSLQKTEQLGKTRAKELLESAEILGVKKVYFLGFVDGTLCNNMYHKLAQKIEEKVKTLKADTLLTFDQTGISGHIDHITVSLVTTHVFYKLQLVKTLLYSAISLERQKAFSKEGYFIYFPKGRTKNEIDKVVDISNVWEKKVKAMMIHKSQRHDADRILRLTKNLPKEEYFLVLKK